MTKMYLQSFVTFTRNEVRGTCKTFETDFNREQTLVMHDFRGLKTMTFHYVAKIIQSFFTQCNI